MSESKLVWDDEALKRLEKIPVFVRKMAQGKIEKAAEALGEARITVELMDRIKKESGG
ncbi:MAG TPA: PCP reductase family protein [Thermodesulfobacteriota bacterium]|nr:PCP reductase family protein [Thermodesulfobacteriota bacterium]